MKRLALLLVIISIHIVVFGDVRSQCQTLLDKAEKEFKTQNYAKALEYFTEVKTIAEKNNLPIMQLKTLNNMALAYKELLDYEKAMECFLEAYQIAIKKTDKEYKTAEIGILNNISILYKENKEFNKAKENAFKAYKAAIQLQDSLHAGICAMNLASYANQTGDLEEAEKQLNIAEKMFENQPEYFSMRLIEKGIRMENLYLKKEYDQAKQLALEILNPDLTVLDNDFKAEILLCLSRIYQQKKEFQKAIATAKDALSISPKLPLTINMYEQLSNLYLEMDDPYRANQYLQSMMVAKDSLNKIMNTTNVMVNQVKFDLMSLEKTLAESKAKQKLERMLFIFIGTFIIFSLLILIWVFRMRVTKNKQSKMIAELELEKQTNEKLLLKQQMKEREVLSLLEQRRLNDEIDAKNRQLTSKLLFQSNRNELIKEIIHALAKIPNSDDPIPIIKSVIRMLKMQVKESTDWNDLLIHFEQINPAFLTALKEKHPDLTASEIRLSSYIYLNLNTKEISKLLNITHEYCRKKKQQLSKKMNISTQEMYQYMTNIYLS